MSWLMASYSWPLLIVLAILGFALGAWLLGRREGKRAAQRKADRKRADDLTIAKEERDNVEAQSNSDVRDNLGKWVRKDHK